ncbi:hypothetical protein E2C01_091924 [Portunus trituberculatus]|uniref:Uncharacterized protein n=1 Tax=Portunus trituberculatus TaxID=210409 RepID=A0A5B7JQE0_PORTR|nr:hypothetical protein [Portunus trituberculatus]
MTLGQSSPQLEGREGNIIRLPSRARKIYAETFHSLAVTCPRSYMILLRNTGKVLREEVDDSLRICQRSPSRQQIRLGGSRILPTNSADFVKDIRKRNAGINRRYISFPRGSLCLFQNGASPRSTASKSFQALLVPTMSPETRESCPFFFHSFSACCVPPRNGTFSKATGRPRDCLKRY